MRRLGIVILALVGIGVAFLIQQRCWEEQRDQGVILDKQIAQREAELTRLSAPPESKSPSGPQNLDLLRLRGEVGMLRETTAAKLRDQIQLGQATLNQLQYEKRQADMAQAILNLGSTIVRYGKFHAGYGFATNFDMMDQELGGRTNINGFGLEAFEFVNAGRVDRSMPDKIVLRERSPRRTPDGQYERAYFMADGSVQVRTSDDGSFDEWDRAGAVTTFTGQ